MLHSGQSSLGLGSRYDSRVFFRRRRRVSLSRCGCEALVLEQPVLPAGAVRCPAVGSQRGHPDGLPAPGAELPRKDRETPSPGRRRCPGLPPTAGQKPAPCPALRTAGQGRCPPQGAAVSSHPHGLFPALAQGTGHPVPLVPGLSTQSLVSE